MFDSNLKSMVLFRLYTFYKMQSPYNFILFYIILNRFIIELFLLNGYVAEVVKTKILAIKS